MTDEQAIGNLITKLEKYIEHQKGKGNIIAVHQHQHTRRALLLLGTGYYQCLEPTDQPKEQG